MTRHLLPRWNDLKPPVMREDAASMIAVLPLGAQEQHGPHLPPQTDTIIADGLVSALRKEIPADLSVAFLPTEPVGYSVEHVDLGETVTLAWDEAVQRWIDIAEMLHRNGIRKLLMLNAHGGNSPLMTVVATEARVRFDMLAVATSWTRFGLPPNTVSDEEKAFGIHAGEIETSVMLALRPDLVDMRKARSFLHSRNISTTTPNFCAPMDHTHSAGPCKISIRMERPATLWRRPPRRVRS